MNGWTATSNDSEIQAEMRRRADLDGYVVRAVTTLSNGQIRVQHFASLHSAIRAQDRATRRQCQCVLSLCRVVPVGHVELDELEGGEVR